MKKYIGGYRNKLTKVIYYHAQTQTFTETKQKVVLYCRETQTTTSTTRSCQSARDAGTITDGIYSSGKILPINEYISSGELLIKKNRVIVCLQKAWRAHKAKMMYEQIKTKQQTETHARVSST